MNHLIERNDDALGLLAQEKSFDSLSGAEKHQVLALMSEAEYRKLRDLSLASNSYFRTTNKLKARSSTRDFVKSRMRIQKAQKRTRNTWNSFRNPVYQVAAAIALLACFIHFSNQPNSALVPSGSNPGVFSDSTIHDSSLQKDLDSSFEDTVFSEMGKLEL